MREIDKTNIALYKAQVEALEKQLDSIKYLNRQEVQKVIEKYIYYHKECVDAHIEYHGSINDDLITAICKLALPDIDRDRIAKEIEHESINLIGVIHEIIQRCFIDYEKLPKANDIKGIIQEAN